MIAVLFEAMAVTEKKDRYFQLAEQLKPLLSNIEGFISIERFQSTTNPDKFISLSWWQDEEAIKKWKKNVQHKLAQNEGKSSIFSSYKINVLTSTTTSSHLSRLLKSNLVICLSQGRHRYFRLYNSSVAELLEKMMGMTFPVSRASRAKVPKELRKARTCYDHLAGEIAVKLYDSLVKNHWIESDGKKLTIQGQEKLLQLGVHLNAKTRRKACCPCLDWSERKFHVGGYLGASLLSFFENNHWIERVSGYREVMITSKGKKELDKHFFSHQ